MALLEFDDERMRRPRIKVIGCGGGGGNAVNTMVAARLEGVEFIAANTDLQALESNLAPVRVGLGARLTRGLGAGANPDVGRNATLEAEDRIREVLEGSDMVFVTAGMGGGTGTGAAPVVARIAREMGALTVGVVTKPFGFEGRRRMRYACEGIDALASSVDTLITIPNERLLSVAGESMSMLDAFKKVDDVLLDAVQGISRLISMSGLINVDFADVRTVMSGKGRALMGTGRGMGADRALEAARAAISSPLLEDVSIDGATGILINITGGPSMTLQEAHRAAAFIEDSADEDALVIFGSVVDPTLTDELFVTVIATGFDQVATQQSVPAPRVRESSSPSRVVQNSSLQMPMTYAAQAAAASPAVEPVAELQVEEVTGEFRRIEAVREAVRTEGTERGLGFGGPGFDRPEIVPPSRMEPLFPPRGEPYVSRFEASPTDNTPFLAERVAERTGERTPPSGTPVPAYSRMDQSVITQPVPTRVAAPMRRTPPTGQHRMIVAPVEPGLVGDESEFDVPTYIRRQMLQSGE